MGTFYETIPQSLIAWVLAQKMFWVATAPLSADGHVNVSPKGGPYFGVPSNQTFWYMDLTGSGNETISHLHEPGNGRVTIMFMAFEGSPKIVRFWGHGRVIENGTPEFSEFITEHKITTIPGTRSIILVDIHQVGSSCGFSVPTYEFKDFRPVLNDFFEKKEQRFKSGKEDEALDRYWAHKNAYSIDGLPGMKTALEVGKKEKVEPIKKMVGPFANQGEKIFRNRGAGGQRNYSLGQLGVAMLLALVFGVLVGGSGVRY